MPPEFVVVQPEALPPFVPVLIGGLLATIVAWFAFRANRSQRLITDLPTSKTTGVFIGFNELKGQATSSQPLESPISNTPCVAYSYLVQESWSRVVRERYRDDQGRVRTRTRHECGWATLDSGGRNRPFFLRDDHGEVLVRPEGAEIEMPTMFSRTCGRVDPLYYSRGPRGSVPHSDHRRRFVESGIPIGARLYVLGQARERDDIVAAEIAVDPNSPEFLVSTRTEEQIVGGKRSKAGLLGVLGAVFAGGGVAARYLMENLEPVVFWIVLAVFIYAVVWFVCWGISVANSIIGLRNRVRQAESLIDVQLKRRNDLIPQLAEVTRQAASQERSVLVGLTRLRGAADQRIDEYRPTAAGFMALSEDYPEIQSGENFLQLQKALSDTEDRIALARSYHNEMASFLSNRLEMFPDSLFAKIAGVRSHSLILATDEDREVPRAAETLGQRN